MTKNRIKMKDIKYLAIGFFALFTTIGLNLRHAVNDYGILNNKLHVEVLEQSNSNGGSSSGGGGSSGGSNNSGVGNKYYYEHLQGRPKPCTLYKAVSANGSVSFSSENTFGAGYTVTTLQGMSESCPKSGKGCTVYSCHVTGNTGSGC